MARSSSPLTMASFASRSGSATFSSDTPGACLRSSDTSNGMCTICAMSLSRKRKLRSAVVGSNSRMRSSVSRSCSSVVRMGISSSIASAEGSMPLGVRIKSGSPNASRRRCSELLVADCDSPTFSPASVTLRVRISASNTSSRLRSSVLKFMAAQAPQSSWSGQLAEEQVFH